MRILFNSVMEYAKSNNIRMHMPGHSGILHEEGMFLQDAFKMDITELSFSDNLENPNQIILQAEKNAANAYSCYHSFYITSGATTAIFTALLVAKEFSKKIGYAGDCHKSFFSFCKLINLEIEKIERLDDISKFECVFFTTPNYFGECKTIQDWAFEAIKQNVFTIVDEAHGSHFAFSELLPESLSGKADIVIESLHKTLPVLTGGALINIKNASIYNAVLHLRQKIHTSSPSYLVMSSIDFAIDFANKNADKIYKKIYKLLDKEVYKRDYSLRPYTIRKTDDFTRLVFTCNSCDAKDLSKYLESKGVFCECVIKNEIIMIVNLNNYTFVPLVMKIMESYNYEEKYVALIDDRQDDSSEELYTIDKKFLSIDKAEGYVSASEIGLYPPGVPIVHVGDIITKEIILEIKSSIDNVFGLIGNKIIVFSNKDDK